MKVPLSIRVRRGKGSHPESPTRERLVEATYWDSCLGYLCYHGLWESNFHNQAIQEAVVGSSAAEAVRMVGPRLPCFLANRSGASYSTSLNLSSLFCNFKVIASCHQQFNFCAHLAQTLAHKRHPICASLVGTVVGGEGGCQ